ncbi:DUF4383 domain-containing protein [Candidatus Nomurabacteria bacterium]|nr:DUF4383 domain-containing protein [Candidatus Nomurabacteria bacterium]
MDTSKLAKWFGVVMLAVGVLGFVPGVTSNGHLLGIFEVDMLHNVIHLLTGVLALMFASSAPKTFFKVFGVVYLVVTVAGFVQGSTVLGLIGVNMADNLLHLVIAVLALMVGFKRDSMGM